MIYRRVSHENRFPNIFLFSQNDYHTKPQQINDDNLILVTFSDYYIILVSLSIKQLRLFENSEELIIFVGVVDAGNRCYSTKITLIITIISLFDSAAKRAIMTSFIYSPVDSIHF